eukprot:TRINITY_DN8865_c0_g1_i2.p2 TRINITY_DN8865_c0_g1~~TRINITY_DN8865_c0_g1_i2.p2  ORF type:complete len:173 (+),score=25.49 TRINITY_DN8865_c0_g1_i2:1055-1573(+)
MATALKCFAVGDNGSGKTSMIMAFADGVAPRDYIPVGAEDRAKTLDVDGQSVDLTIHDTAGGPDYDHLRPKCYPGTDVFLLIYSIARPVSYRMVIEKWHPELKRHCPKVPILLVGLQRDVRNDEERIGKLADGIVTYDQVRGAWRATSSFSPSFQSVLHIAVDKNAWCRASV